MMEWGILFVFVFIAAIILFASQEHTSITAEVETKLQAEAEAELLSPKVGAQKSAGITARMRQADRAEAEAKLQAEAEANFLASVESRLNQFIQAHIKTLAKKQSQTVTQDDYGNYIVERWNQELDYFIENVLAKDELISSYLHVNLIRTMQAAGVPAQALVETANARILEIHKKIGDAVGEYEIKEIENQDGRSIDIDSLDPIEFEHHCAELLRNDGWDARVTQASGDQGIDVIATRGNVKAVFQCKKYAQPVGNGAVQEIVAGKQFERADIAAVVSNATFTPSAKQLAGTTGVHLLHYSELHGLAEKLGMA